DHGSHRVRRPRRAARRPAPRRRAGAPRPADLRDRGGDPPRGCRPRRPDARRHPGRGGNGHARRALLPGPAAPGSHGLRAVTPIGTPILAVEGVTVAYGERRIVDDVSLTVAAGHRLALVGPNGAGKSTLLRTLTGVLEPRRGMVRLRGIPIRTIDDRTVARTIAVVPELTQLPFAMPVHEVVALGRLP